ncbi:hypothetical protein FBU30_009408 [Linnemannia zychae]|nr:hypothetical protein FBU30_009408 [Linnemannia zychae]
MSPRFVAPIAPKCPRCTKSVYSAEQVIGPNGAAWHKACFTCRECNRRLDSNILAEHEGEAYCKTCHKKMWGPTGYGYASGVLVREDPESQFKQSIGRPPNSAGSQNDNSGNYATLDEVVYNNTGGSNLSAGRDHNNTYDDGETEEQRRERLTPVNATLKKRSSLDIIREQAEASRRAYDEAHNQRIASKYGKVNSNSTGGSTASTGSRPELHFGGSSNHLHSQSGYISAGSDSSSAFGSTKATTSSPAPSFSSISSTTSSQPATKSLFLNQSYRVNSSNSTPSYQDAESDYARSRQALNFQTGAPITSPSAPVSAGPPSLPKRAPEPVRELTPTPQQNEEPDFDDDVQAYMPIRVVARKEEPTPAHVPIAPAVEEDEWDAAPTQKQPEQPVYRSQYLKQQEQREREQREQEQREKEFLSRARISTGATATPVLSTSASNTPTSTNSARLNSLINETDRLTLREQEQRHNESAPSNEVDEWDEDPTPTMPSKPQNMSYSPARNISPAATRTWTPNANTLTESTDTEQQQRFQPSNTNYSRISSNEINNNNNKATSTIPVTTVPKTSYYRSGGLMTPKKMTATFGGGGDICPRCQKTVYHAESALAPGGAKYHKLCLRCVECSKSLDSTNMTDRQGTPYCKSCYSKAWGAKGYGYGSGASMLHTEL